MSSVPRRRSSSHVRRCRRLCDNQRYSAWQEEDQNQHATETIPRKFKKLYKNLIEFVKEGTSFKALANRVAADYPFTHQSEGQQYDPMSNFGMISIGSSMRMDADGLAKGLATVVVCITFS